jgi:hypothetical protein
LKNETSGFKKASLKKVSCGWLNLISQISQNQIVVDPPEAAFLYCPPSKIAKQSTRNSSTTTHKSRNLIAKEGAELSLGSCLLE